MITSKTRNIIITLATVATMSATGVTGVASAATTLQDVGVSTLKVQPVAAVSTVVAESSGHTTGQPGSATEKQCQTIGADVDGLDGLADGLMSEGKKAEAIKVAEKARAKEDAGLDVGCFFID